ncbi:AfsR/SARP family transcriptional regulator [Streptomyces mayteni]
MAASTASRTLDLGPPKQRGVLAALLVDVGRVVPVERLIDRVWADDPPRTARGTLYGYVARLRATLRGGAELTQRAGGYLLDAPRDSVDLHRFRDLVGLARAEADQERSATLLREALGLWGAEPLAGLPGEWAEGLRTRLAEERIAAWLAYGDIRLSQGRAEELLPELSELTATHPLDERLGQRRMRALYRCGRQAEALGFYEGVRQRLAEELGVAPGTGLQQEHHRILAFEPALDAPSGRSFEGRRPPEPTLVPRQLPPSPSPFVGREAELAELDRASEDRRVVAVVGAGGVGKTWLALHWAHRRLDRFPDGQLYADLAGFTPEGEPAAAPEVIVRGFLNAFSVAPATIPAGAEARRGLFRSLVAGRRLLIVLDNAHDAEQVAPLLPGGSSVTVLVTSRDRLIGLSATQGALPLPLDVLGPVEARGLLGSRLGAERVAAEPEAVAALLSRCGGMPLALGILAARAATHPGFPLAHLAEELRDATDVLDALDVGEQRTGLRAVFAASYQALDPAVARVFALVGLAPGGEISLAAAASLAGHPLSRAREALRALEAAHLLHQHSPGRYRMHDLVRLYAVERGERELTTEARHAALRRLMDYYLHTSHAADRLIYPHRPVVPLPAPPEGCTPQPLADLPAALAWFEAERPGMLALIGLRETGRACPRVWQLAWTLDTFLWRQGYHPDRLATWRTGYAAAQETADPVAMSLAHWRLGHAYVREGSRPVAFRHLHHALDMFETAGDTVRQAWAHQALAWAWTREDDHHRALSHAESSLLLHQAGNDRVWEANALNAVGWCHAQLGRFEAARTHCRRALDLLRDQDDPYGEAAALDSLGYIAHHSGNHAGALGWYRRALVLRRTTGDAINEADTLARIGDICQALGRPVEARRAWRQALERYGAQHRGAEAEHVRALIEASSDPRREQTATALGGE